MTLIRKSAEKVFLLLQKHHVEYLIVGGIAVNYYGVVRTTGDIDVWVNDSAENRQKLVNALLEYGIVGAEALLKTPLLAGYTEILIGDGIYLDIMSTLQVYTESDFAECYVRAEEFKLNEEVTLKMIHVRDLIKEKKVSKRLKDQDDAQKLDKLH